MPPSPHEEQKTVWTVDAETVSDFLTVIGEFYLIRSLQRKGKDLSSDDVQEERELFRQQNSTRFLSGFSALLKLPEANRAILSPIDEDLIKEELAQVAIHCRKLLEEAHSIDDFISRHLQGQVSLRRVLGFSDRTMQRCYTCGYELLKHKRFDEAADFFWLLSSLDSFISVYWLGLGIAEQHREHWKQALYAYTMATIADETNPLPQYRSAQCYAALGDTVLAVNALDLAIAQCGDDPKYATLREQAVAWKETL